MNNIIPFDFQGHSVRVLMMGDEPWFVARDVARLLGYSDTAKAIRTHCKGVGETATPSNGGVQTVKIIPERDVYRLIMRSKLPAAEAFEEWVVGEVLPSIRKTGQYTSHKVESSQDVKMLIEANRLFKSNLTISKTFFKGNQALLSANMATRKATNVDVLKNMGATHLLSPERDALLTASDIGKQLGGLSGRKVNTLLEQNGFVVSFRDHKNRKQYDMTAEGEPFGQVLDTTTHQANQMVQQSCSSVERGGRMNAQLPADITVAEIESINKALGLDAVFDGDSHTLQFNDPATPQWREAQYAVQAKAA